MSQILNTGMGGGPPGVVVETLTADTGGPISPTANNINILGGPNINTSGTALTSTIDVNLNETIHWPNTNAAGTVGAIYLAGTNGAGGELFMHDYDAGLGNGSTWLGLNAGNLTNTGSENTGIGGLSLNAIGSGEANTSVGCNSLSNLVDGYNNVSIGVFSLFALEDGAVDGASSYNTSLGTSCGQNLLTGSWNVFIGTSWGDGGDFNASGINYIGAESSNILINNRGIVGESNTMRLGTETGGASDGSINATYIAGIYGRTVGAGTGVPVVVDVNGLMGTVVSSKRFKNNIQDINHESEGLYTLRPISYVHRDDNSHRKQYGLIAEEVEETFPELVIYQKGDPRGDLLTVKYQDIPVLLLNELKKHETLIQSLIKRINILEEQLQGDFDEL